MMQTANQKTQQAANSGHVHVGFSDYSDTDMAINHLLDELEAEESELTVVFFSPSYDEKIISRVLDRRLGSRAVAGSTAGEISAQGMVEDTIVGMSLHGSHVRATIDVVPNLDELSLVPLVHLPDQFARRIGRSRQDLDPDRHIWLMLADGLSGAEDLLTPFFMQASPDANLVGGSLADGTRYESVSLSHFGRLYNNAAAIILLEYNRPFELFHENHMEFTDRWLEVTSVARGGRVLEQLNGRPAREAYAEALGLAPEEVTPEVTAVHPLGFRFRGRPFVCSILHEHGSGGFFMGNSLHAGEELNLLEPGDIVSHTRDALRGAVGRLQSRHGASPQGMLMFHCLARFVEARQLGVVDELSEVFTEYPIAGFNSYGEQFGSMHTNHSMTGVIFG